MGLIFNVVVNIGRPVMPICYTAERPSCHKPYWLTCWPSLPLSPAAQTSKAADPSPQHLQQQHGPPGLRVVLGGHLQVAHAHTSMPTRQRTHPLAHPYLQASIHAHPHPHACPQTSTHTQILLIGSGGTSPGSACKHGNVDWQVYSISLALFM